MKSDSSPWAEILVDTTEKPTARGWSVARCCSPPALLLLVASQATENEWRMIVYNGTDSLDVARKRNMTRYDIWIL